MVEEAYASGLHPWEFDRYTMEDLVFRRRGKIKARRIELQQEFQHIRVLARYIMLPHLSKGDKARKLDQLVPDIYENNPGMKNMNLADRLKAATERLQKHGYNV